MQKQQRWSLETSLTLFSLKGATEIPLESTTLNPALLSSFPVPRTTLQMPQSAIPLQGPLVAMGLDL